MAAPLASAVLREATWTLHQRAERSGILRDLLRGGAERAGYALLLRNLLPAYQALELGLAAIGPPGIDWAALRRAPALAADLTALCGPAWPSTLPLLPAGLRYRERVARASASGVLPLLAHAYVRYLGDLSGGQVLRRRLQATLGLAAGSLACHDFPAIADLAACTQAFRAVIDHAAGGPATLERLADEARVAFRLNISVAEAVRFAVPATRPAVFAAGA